MTDRPSYVVKGSGVVVQVHVLEGKGKGESNNKCVGEGVRGEKGEREKERE